MFTTPNIISDHVGIAATQVYFPEGQCNDGEKEDATTFNKTAAFYLTSACLPPKRDREYLTTACLPPKKDRETESIKLLAGTATVMARARTCIHKCLPPDKHRQREDVDSPT